LKERAADERAEPQKCDHGRPLRDKESIKVKWVDPGRHIAGLNLPEKVSPRGGREKETLSAKKGRIRKRNRERLSRGKRELALPKNGVQKLFCREVFSPRAYK